MLIFSSSFFYHKKCKSYAKRGGVIARNCLYWAKMKIVYPITGSDICFYEKGYEFLFPVVEMVAPASAIVIVQADAQFFAVP